MSKPEHVTPIPVFKAEWTHVNQCCLLQITSSLEQMREFLSGTLLYVQRGRLCVERSLWEEVQQSVHLLKDKGLITETADSHGQTLQVTKLGKATYKGKSLSLCSRLKYLNSCWMDWAKCGSDVHVPLRMNCDNFGDPLTFTSCRQAQWIWPTATCCTKTSLKVWRVCCSTVTSTWSTWSHRTTWFHSASPTGWCSSDRYRIIVTHYKVTSSQLSVKQVLLLRCCSSPCCQLQSRRCLQPSACRRVLLREKLQDRRWKR